MELERIVVVNREGWFGLAGVGQLHPYQRFQTKLTSFQTEICTLVSVALPSGEMVPVSV